MDRFKNATSYAERYHAMLDHFGVDPSRQQIAAACAVHEYMGWVADIAAYTAWAEAATSEDKLIVGHILSDTSPRYAMDVGYVQGALAAYPVDERKTFCRGYR